MSHHVRIPYRELHSETQRIAANERGHLMLLHVDAVDAAPTHTVILALPVEHQHPSIAPTVGRPLPDFPELRVSRVWPNATLMDARRLLRHSRAIVRLCPICSPYTLKAEEPDCG